MSTTPEATPERFDVGIEALDSAFNHYHHFHGFNKDGLIENME